MDVRLFPRTDREMAAMPALRSYAAANGGKLPEKLEEVTDTPVPVNPMTGKAFEYHVSGETATLTDAESESALAYSITIRK